jgi:hypothetical protein
MLASEEQNIILFNELNKFSNEPTRIQYSIYYIPKKRLFEVQENRFSLKL